MSKDCTFDHHDACSCDCDDCALLREFAVEVLEEELADRLATYSELDYLRDSADTMGY